MNSSFLDHHLLGRPLLMYASPVAGCLFLVSNHVFELQVKPEKGKTPTKRDFGTFFDLTQESAYEKPSKLAKTVWDDEVEFIDLTDE